MRRLRLWPMLVLAVMVVLLGAGSTAASRPQRVEIRIHYSAFHPSAISVPSGVPITFVLINEDPIDHEWLLGDAAFHSRHRKGAETHHGTRPNEVSVGAFTFFSTAYTPAAE